MIATVSPAWTPRPASPAAIDSTRAAYSRQLMDTAPPSVRTAISSGYAATVAWNAWHRVGEVMLTGILLDPLCWCRRPGRRDGRHGSGPQLWARSRKSGRPAPLLIRRPAAAVLPLWRLS